MQFRKALPADAEPIMEIICQAQARMQAAGSVQWQDGYPALHDIEADIACGRGLVACLPTDRTGTDASAPAGKEAYGSQTTGRHHPVAQASAVGTKAMEHRAQAGSRIIGYAAILFDGEPAYDAIEGAWCGEPEYVALHRLAVADEALHKGVGRALLREAMRMARARGLNAFRIDTACENRPMRRLLTALGFMHRGTVRYASGERMAFEKRLDDETC